jgi:hypothetical protein
MGRLDESREFAAPSRWWVWVEVALIVAVFFAAVGDRPPHVNESHYLCRLKHYWNPSWGAGDLFLESTDTQLLLIWMLGWVTRFASLTTTAWIGRVLAWTATAWAWQRLSWRVAPRRFVSVLSAALMIGLTFYCHFAGEWVVGGVEAKCFAYAFVFMALRDVIDTEWNWAWLWLGAATAFHPLVGGWSGIICVGIWLIDVWRGLAQSPHPGPLPEGEGERGPHAALALRERVLAMLPGLIVGGAIGLVGIVPALMLTWHVPADVVAESSRIYVFDRLPHHLAPLTLPSEERTRRLTGHAILLVTMLGLWWLTRGLRCDEDESSNSQRPCGLAALDPSHPIQCILLFALGALVLAAIGLMIEITLQSQPLLAAKLLRYYWFRMTDIAAAMAVALQITVLVCVGLERRRLWALPALVGAIVLAAWFPVNACWLRVTSPNSPTDQKIMDYPAWVEVCDWVVANTPPDALFITPRLNSSFRWRTGRPEVANRKDIPQDAASIVEWSRRLKDVYGTEFGGVPYMVDSIADLGDERVLEIAQKYHAHFVLSDRKQLLKLPVAFQNEEYIVYRIDEPPVGNGR